MKILVIEDDSIVAQTLELLLATYNYAVDIAADGEVGWQMIEAFEYDLIVLDVGLPKLDGISLCQHLRSQGVHTPVLLLTGQGGGQQKAIALNAGADDYVVKPFDTGELIARVQALLRRGGPTTQPVLTWEHLAVDPSSRKVTYGTHLLAVTPKEYAILELLLRNVQKPLSAQAILDHVWASLESPGEEAVRVHIMELRQKLKAAGAPKDFVKTVYRVGYRLNPIYSSFLATQQEAQLTAPQIAELQSLNEELRDALEQLRLTQTELHQKNQELEQAYQTIAQEQQQLQATRDALEHRAAERTMELVQANQSLQQQQEQWQALFDHALDAIVIADDSGAYIDANPAACELFGVPRSHLLGASVTQFSAPGSDTVEFWQHFLKQGRMAGEFRLHRPDGTTRDTEFAAIAHFVPGRHLSILRDISERKSSEAERQQAETALRESERRLSTLMNNLPGYAYRVANDPDYTPEFISEGVVRVTGFRQSEYLIKRTISCGQEMHPDDRDRVWELVQQSIAAHQPYECEYRIITKTGMQKWVWERGQGLYAADGRLLCLEGFVTDITERKQVEVELRQREEFLSSIYNGADQAVFVVDVTPSCDFSAGKRGDETRQETPLCLVSSPHLPSPNFHYVGFNHLAERFAGMRHEEIYGKTPEEAFGSEIGARFRQNYARCLQAGTSQSYEEHIVFENHTLWTLTTLSPLRDEQGAIYRIVGTAIDISDRKQAEFLLQRQIQREQLITEISQDIRQSLNLNHVLSRTVERVRELLVTDRVILFRFRSDGQGDVIMESVGAGWLPILSTTISDPCFIDRYVEPYRQGRIATMADIDREDVAPCYRELLQSFQVRANLVVPILQGENLWGLLIVHHCAAPRQWSPSEVDLLRQLATQVSIAIRQSELYQQTHHELLERERMQSVLEESEERFRTLSAAAPIGICQTNADGICLYTNARWQAMAGLSFADSLGNGWLQAVHPEDRQTLLRAWDAVIQGEGDRLPEFRLLPSWGDVRWVSARVAAMKSVAGDTLGYVCTLEDITDRKLTEQKIREQAALIDIATDAIFVRDLENRILFWSQGAERLYGWTADEALGQCAHNLFGREAHSELEIGLKTAMTQGFWQGELAQTTKTGEHILVASRWTLVQDSAGHPQSLLVVNTDITEKKRLEAQFYHAQRLESLGTLTSGIAHDLNNVLTPILAISQLLRLKQPNLDVRSQEMLKTLEDSAKKGANMVKQVLTFARGTDGTRVPLHLGALLQELTQVIQQTFPKSIAVHYFVPDEPLWLVSADPTHLHQVIMNLCVNARDAMPDGGSLTLTVADVQVDAEFAQRHLNAHLGDYVMLTVADTGTGISPEVRDRVFEPFFTTKQPGQGTGLGLSTVLGIVKSYDGFVQVISEVGQGTEFRVYLPATDAGLQAFEAEETLLQGAGELVLVVDDDPVVQQTHHLLLESYHYRTIAAQDGNEAIAVYRQHAGDISLVLMDIMMPNMDGIATVQSLCHLNPAVKILAISGLPAHKEAVLAAGASGFLAKPYTLEDLLQQLHDLGRSPYVS